MPSLSMFKDDGIQNYFWATLEKDFIRIEISLEAETLASILSLYYCVLNISYLWKE